MSALSPEARVALSRRPPPRQQVEALLARLEPGARLLRLRRLKGGISTRTFEAVYAAPAATPRSVVLRVYVPENWHSDAESVRSQWRTLQVLEERGVAAPRAVLLDPAGEFFGDPCMVISRLPGGPLLYPRRWPSFLTQLAMELAAVHEITPATADLTHLEGSCRQRIQRKLSGPVDDKLADRSLAQRAWELLRRRIDEIGWLPSVLVHDDYWPGNTVWHRGRLSGIVDWNSARIGDPRTDVAQCRVDLTLMYGDERADEFAAAYVRRAGPVLNDLWFWDAYLSLSALASLHYYVDGYFDLGLRDQGISQRTARLEAFLKAAIEQAS